MKLPKFIKENLLLKMTSLNAGVILIRLFIGFFIQRELTQNLVSGGYAKVGSLRNLMQILTSFTSLGIFNGIVKYVAEHKEDKDELQRLFSTAFVFVIIGSVSTFIVLFFFSEPISNYFFYSTEYSYIIKIIAVIAPFISIQRIFNGVVNGLSQYKDFAKIELLAYLISSIFTIWFLYKYDLDGVLIAIILIPIIQVAVMLFIFVKVLREYVQFSKIKFKTPLAKSLLAFSLMSFVSTILLSFLEVDIRGMIKANIGNEGADVWTGMTTLSKNYMVFSGAIFTLYVIPKFTGIYNKKDFLKETGNIYKTLLPLFAVGMIVIYYGRHLIVDYIFVDYVAMKPLFKWQLLGDFLRLATIVLGNQFFAKKMVKSFIFSELLSIVLFYFLAYYLSNIYGVEGVVMGHFIRYLILLFVVFYLVMRSFKKQHKLE
ncbi:MAG: O-antigen/teichoic acid export membrane protein [Flavobacteriaceae bacterium]|uniref:O-antigen translocase n=1 Tax=Candidatus Marifrigoribacter sp. Uisw_064 TaxID=3230970 RepID=UPI003AE602CD